MTPQSAAASTSSERELRAGHRPARLLPSDASRRRKTSLVLCSAKCRFWHFSTVLHLQRYGSDWGESGHTADMANLTLLVGFRMMVEDCFGPKTRLPERAHLGQASVASVAIAPGVRQRTTSG